MMFRANLRRLAHIAAVLFKHAFAHALGERLDRMPRLAGRLPTGVLTRPQRLRAILEDLGGTFIKFGQMLALQPDILPFEYCDALFDLLDRVAPFPLQDVERTFLEEIKRRPSEVFDSFESKPLATASVGQVHLAILKGRKVAVKVRRPNVDTDFGGDLRLMSMLVNWIYRLRLKRIYWLTEPINEFIGWTREELDFRNEARYMAQLAHHSRDNQIEQVPEVFWECTSRRTIVTEYLEGQTVLGYLRAREAGDELQVRRLRTQGFEPNQFARNIIRNFLGDAFEAGIFHADLHPANLLILQGNAVGYVDFGITGILSAFSRRNLVQLTLAYTQGDREAMSEAFVRGASTDATSDYEGFRKGLDAYYDDWYEGEGSSLRLKKNFTLVMLDMLMLARRTRIYPERDVIKYIRSSIAIDGLITRFAPGFDVGGYLAEICGAHLKRGFGLSHEKILDGSLSGSRLARSGLYRAAEVMERMAAGRVPLQVEASKGRSRTADGRQALQAAIVSLVLALLIILGPPPAQLGWNFYTVGLALFAAAAGLTLKNVRRLI